MIASGEPPYGPLTPQVRAFLKRLSQLSGVAWLAAARRYEEEQSSSTARRADRALANAFTRAQRVHVRDALVGPVVQLARKGAILPEAHDEQALERLAEPALAAAFAVALSDVLEPADRDTLYAAFADAIPFASL